MAERPTVDPLTHKQVLQPQQNLIVLFTFLLKTTRLTNKTLSRACFTMRRGCDPCCLGTSKTSRSPSDDEHLRKRVCQPIHGVLLFRVNPTHLESAASPEYVMTLPFVSHAIFLVPMSITSGDPGFERVPTTMPPSYVTATESAPPFEQRNGKQRENRETAVENCLALRSTSTRHFASDI